MMDFFGVLVLCIRELNNLCLGRVKCFRFFVVEIVIFINVMLVVFEEW